MPLQTQEELQTVSLFYSGFNAVLLPAAAALVIYINLLKIYIDHHRMWRCHLIGPNPFENPALLIIIITINIAIKSNNKMIITNITIVYIIEVVALIFL